MLPIFALPVTLNAPPVTKLAPVMLPVAVISPVPILPTLALPVTLNAPPVTKLAPVILPLAVIKPAVPILPILELPVTLSIPEINDPVLETTKTFAVPALLNVKFPLFST